jgi:four helix bundle suffix protein
MKAQNALKRPAEEGSVKDPKKDESILPPHGGYRSLRSFQVGQLVYDLTVRFRERYIPRGSRTRDQMVQAARSGVQNIAEGSEMSATSKKMELKLTQVARASIEELKLDYEDYLRQHGLTCWDRHHPLRQALVDAKCRSTDDVALWVMNTARMIVRERGQSEQSGQRGSGRMDKGAGSSELTASSLYPEISANAGLTLATVAGYLLDRQIQSLAESFKNEGGFTERLYRVRTSTRRRT